MMVKMNIADAFSFSFSFFKIDVASLTFFDCLFDEGLPSVAQKFTTTFPSFLVGCSFRCSTSLSSVIPGHYFMKEGLIS